MRLFPGKVSVHCMGLRTLLQRLVSARRALPAHPEGESAPAPGSRERRRQLEDLGRNAGGILHDLNNLLTIITGYSELALSHEGNPEALRNSLHEIHQSAVYASALTRHYLRRSTEPSHSREVSDINQVLRNMRGTLQGILGSSIELKFDLAPAGSPVHASAVQMVQIILNLTLNARDAMPAGGWLHIGTSTVDFSQLRNHPRGGEVFVVLSVHDTGVGMNRNTREQIFDPFFTTKSHAGTGLGLTTVRDIARSAGGFVRVESEPGHGTCFRVYLPQAGQKSAGASHAGVSAVAHPSLGGAIARVPSVLVVEDQREIKDLIAETLRSDGYQVMDCDRGDNAMELCWRIPSQIDLLIADLHVPGLPGDELADRLHALRPEMRVLLISGDSFRLASLTFSGDPAMTALLNKPFSVSDLRTAVRALLPPRAAAGQHA